MRMQDFVFKISSELDSILAKPEKINRDTNNYIFLLSQRIVFALQKLLPQYRESEVQADEESLKPFIKFLKQVWEKDLKETDAVIFHNSKTHANQIGRFLTELLAQMTNYNQHQLQFPGFDLSANPYDGELNRVVMSDDNRTFIDPLKCLEMARERGDGQLRHTHPVSGQSEFLSPAELNRVIKYSTKAERFYKDIAAHASHAALDKAHNNLRKAMGGTVLCSYGEEGRKRLKNRLYGGIANREQLVNALLKYPNHVWGTFVDNYDLNELHKIVLNNPVDATKQQDEMQKNAESFLEKELFQRHFAVIKEQKDLINSLVMYPRKDWKKFLNNFALHDLIRFAMEGPPILDYVKRKQANTLGNNQDSALAYLANEIFQRLRETIKDQTSLINAAQNYLPLDWPIFLSKFKLDELCSLILNEKEYNQAKFLEILHDPKRYSKNELHNTLTSFTLLDLYRRDLKARPNDYNTFWGWASGYASPKSAKEKVSLIAHNLLARGTRLSELKSTLFDVLNSDKKLSQILNIDIKLNPSERKTLIKAASDGVFGAFIDQTVLVSNPKYHQEQLKSRQILGRH